MGHKSFVLGHEILKPDDSVAIDGEATSIIFDTRVRETIPVPEYMVCYLPARK